MLMAASLQPILPDPLVNCATDHVLMAHHVWGDAPEALRQLRLPLILVRDDQFTPCAITAGLFQGQQSPRTDVDEQRKLPEVCRSVTLGALTEAFIRVRTEHEGAAGWQLADLCFCHGTILPWECRSQLDLMTSDG